MKLVWNDFALAIGLGLNLASRFITNFLIALNIGIIEANPTVSKNAAINYFTSIVEFGLLSAFIIAYYIFLRRRALSNKKELKKQDWEFIWLLFTLFAFILLLLDFINDSGTLFGVLLKHTYKLVPMNGS